MALLADAAPQDAGRIEAGGKGQALLPPPRRVVSWPFGMARSRSLNQTNLFLRDWP